MTQFARTAPKTHGLAGLSVIRAGVARLRHLPRQWAARRQSRLALARLESHLTRDIGLDPMARDAEAHRPFWR